MTDLPYRLALHTWTLDTTPLMDVLRVASEAGWNGVELRHSDFVRCREAGMDDAMILSRIRESGIPVAVLGTEYGFLFARGAEQKRLFGVLEDTCARAVALGCGMLMTATGPLTGDVDYAAASLRWAGDIVAAHGLRLAYEFSSAHTFVNRLEIAREIHARAAHTHCGLLLDAYHLERSGAGGRAFADVPADHLFAFQYSDVPRTPPPGLLRPADRLPPGEGAVRWAEVFGLLLDKGYCGYLSYEAPNPALWARSPLEVARDGAQATRRLLAAAEQKQQQNRKESS